MELYIIRHGQSSNNALDDSSKRVQDAPLTSLGQQQAERIAQYLATAPNPDPAFVNTDSGKATPFDGTGYGITHLYTSVFLRALMTTFPIGHALGLSPQTWVDLHERGGVYMDENGVRRGCPGMSRAEILAKFPGCVLSDDVTENGWWNKDYEDISQCETRAQRVVAQLHQRADQATTRERIAIVTHGTFANVLLKALMGQPSHEESFIWHYNTGMSRVDFLGGGRIIIRYVNRIDHLPPEMVS
jgi:broad specificity phosphatase PhoE